MKIFNIAIDHDDIEALKLHNQHVEDVCVSKVWSELVYADESGESHVVNIKLDGTQEVSKNIPEDIVFRVVDGVEKSLEVYIGDSNIPIDRIDRLIFFARMSSSFLLVHFNRNQASSGTHLVIDEICADATIFDMSPLLNE